MSWIREINWQAPAAVALKVLFARLPPEKRFHITLFGSAPLQIGIEASFLSADVDIFGSEDEHDLLTIAVEEAGIGAGQDRLYIQVCVPGNFRTSPRWQERAFATEIGKTSAPKSSGRRLRHGALVTTCPRQTTKPNSGGWETRSEKRRRDFLVKASRFFIFRMDCECAYPGNVGGMQRALHRVLQQGLTDTLTQQYVANADRRSRTEHSA